MLSYPVRVAVHKNLICQSYAQSSYAMASLITYMEHLHVFITTV